MSLELRPYSESIDRQPKPWLTDAINYLHSISQEQQWLIVRREIGRAVDAISQGNSVLFSLMDDTRAGGIHVVQAMYDPKEGRAIIEEPIDSKQRGGNFASVLHTLEVIAGAVMAVNARDDQFRQPLSFPEVNFAQTLRDHLRNPLHVAIPLTVDPEKANVLAFHPQVDRISPEALAVSYYETIKDDADLPNYLLRHTLLVHALPEDGITKNEAGLRVMLTGERKFSRLLHPERIAKWRNLNARAVTVKRI